jgi:hypothetical protein
VKYFQRILGTSGPGATIGSAPNNNISATNAAGALFLPASNVFNGQQFDVLASGSVGSDTGDPSGTVQISLYVVTGTAAAPIYTEIATTGAVAPTYAGAEPWAIQASLVGDSTSGLLTGVQEVLLGAALVNSTPKVIDAIPGSLNFNTGNVNLLRGAVCGFVVGVTFGTSNSSNTATMYEFTIES